MTKDIKTIINNLFDEKRECSREGTNKYDIIESVINARIPKELQYIIDNYSGKYILDDYGVRGIEESPFSCDGIEKVNCFIGFDGKENLISLYEKLKDEIPENTIPIAEMDGGNYILLGENEYVYAWIHDEPRGCDSFLLAKDFDDFIKRFELLEECEEKLNTENDDEYASEYPEGFWD